MAHPTPRGAYPLLGAYGTSREHEFFRYLPPYHLQAQPLPHVDQDTQSTSSAIRSSLDPALTSFAQLGTFRLNAKRTLISLFGPNAQFVLAEATSHVGLQSDTSDNTRQGLWIGCCTISYQRSLCKSLMKHSQTMEDIYKPLIVTDLSQDEELKNHTDVVNEPRMRFMACSPIVSPKGVLLGSYTVLDDKPHGPLDLDSMKFLTDIAGTVMDHLDATRSRHDFLRSERMIVGFGSFLEGKGSLRSSWIHEHESALTPMSPGEDLEREGLVNQIQQQKQNLGDDSLAATLHNRKTELPFRPHNFDTTRPRKPTTPSTQSFLLAKSNVEARDYFHPRNRRGSHTAVAPFAKGSQKQSPKAKHSAKIKESFSRAANIVRESMEIEAVVFFDANFRSAEALAKRPQSEPDSGSNMESYSSSSEEDAKTRGTHPLQGLSNDPQPKYCGKDAMDPCEILGFATSDAASVNKERLADKAVAMSESLLAQLLRRYPRGYVFNFGADGSISSDETSDGELPLSGTRKFKKTRKSYLLQDGATLRQLAPNARSIVFSPLWDSHKERWYSGCLTWTKAPHHVPTTNDDLAFLFAFGHSLMAEVHRLGAALTERAKSDLLAGISHELRSPLHGIFGTVDILNDTAMDVLQRGFLHTISSCAFTLLGSIDQLLEYASINDVRPRLKKAGSSASANPAPAGKGGSQVMKAGEYSIVQLDAAVEDAIETVFSGYSYLKATDRTHPRNSKSMDGNISNSFDFEDNVKVVLDIDRSKKLKFAARPGAWHVILTNFFGNALKFTEEGFIYVSLKADPVNFDSNGEALQSKITLCIKDTGCGMEEEFLKNELFTAFSKEDKLSIGNGLGINIVNRIVSSLGGEIQITSQKGVGTEVVTTVTLDHVPEYSLPRGSLNHDLFSSNTKALVNGKAMGIILHTSSDGDAALLSAIHRVCENWLHMKVELIDPSDIHLGNCDFYVALHESLAIGSYGILPIRHRRRERTSPPVIIICSSQRTAHSLASQDRKNSGVFEFVSQPCGPYKLAKSLEICVQRQQQRDDSLQRSHPSPSPNSMASDIQSYGKSIQDSTSQNMTLLNKTTAEQTLPKQAITSSLTPPAFLVTPGWDLNAPAPDYLSVQTCSTITPKTILLVDDNEINLKILVTYMKKIGYSYAAARNGQEALDLFKQNAHNIEIILMDISMPVMDGLEATRRIREFEKTLGDKERTLVIALTGVAQVETERAAIGSGMDTFLTKPARLDSLLPLIEPRLRRPETENAER